MSGLETVALYNNTFSDHTFISKSVVISELLLDFNKQIPLKISFK